MVSFLLGLLAIVESYAIIDKIAESAAASRKRAASRQAKLTEQKTKKQTPIKNVSAKTKSQKEQVEEHA